MTAKDGVQSIAQNGVGRRFVIRFSPGIELLNKYLLRKHYGSGSSVRHHFQYAFAGSHVAVIKAIAK